MNNSAKLKRQSFGLIIMLVIQFILGMILNLFVKIPDSHPGTIGSFSGRAVHGFIWALSSGGGIVLTLHVIVAIGLLLGSVALVVEAISANNKPWLIVSIIGALGVITALTNGLAFIGYNNNANSFVMVIGSIVAAISYGTALSFAEAPVVAKKPVKSRASTSTSGKFKHSHS